MIREWARRSVLAWGAVVLGAVAGCGASGTTAFESSTNLKNSAPVTRLVIFENVRSAFYGGELYHGFVEGLKSGFANCGVTASVEHLGELDLDVDRRIASTVETLHASSVMLVIAAGGERTHFSGAVKYELRFKLKLLDVTSNKVTWMADSKLFMSSSWATDDVGSGARFGTSIVSRLRDDGLLAACPGVQ